MLQSLFCAVSRPREHYRIQAVKSTDFINHGSVYRQVARRPLPTCVLHKRYITCLPQL
jgi:hypothetical protein